MNKDRHLFPGGNAPAGFFSYYQYILPQDKANHIFCIKGGPGVGKSTFMKKIGQAMGEKGHPVEYLHCSSDPGSLDGLVIPELNIAFIDGTSPHVVDPKNPGAVDEIINLGECWRLSGIKEHKQDIMDDNRAVGKLFARVYRYLGAAKKIYDDIDAIYTEYIEDTAADIELLKISHLFEGYEKGKKLGAERKLFASAITPDGPMHYLDSLMQDYRDVYEISGTGKQPSAFLAMAAAEAVHRGLDVEEYYCPMEPSDKIEHLLIPSLSLAFTTANRYHTVAGLSKKPIDFSKYMDKQALGALADTLLYDREQFNRLMGQAVETLHSAKAMHDHMETYYIPNMDFDAISKRREEILERILQTVI
jgi:hypothetical protein